jgi:hypothetical protein
LGMERRLRPRRVPARVWVYEPHHSAVGGADRPACAHAGVDVCGGTANPIKELTGLCIESSG